MHCVGYEEKYGVIEKRLRREKFYVEMLKLFYFHFVQAL